MMRGKGIGGILVGLWVVWATSVGAQAPDRGVIESPSAFVSGIGFISGWKCNSQDITLKVLCSPYIHDLDPAQNMLRADTREVCDGRIDNGWIIQVNWEHWAGCTEVTALDNGQQFASRKFTVGEIGDGFIRDHEGTQIRVPGFPSPDQVTHFTWSTATQHFEGMYTTDCGPNDACPGSGEGDDGNNDNPPPGNPPVPYPDMIIIDNAYAGDQDMVQYKGMLDLPSPNYELILFGATHGTRAGARVPCCTHIAHSIIYEPDAWMVTRHTSGAEVRIPKDELPERLDEVDLLYTKTPLMMDISGMVIVNMSGVGGPSYVFDTERIERGSETLGIGIFVNRPELAYEGGQRIQYFINKDTAEIGFKMVPVALNEAGGGWLDALNGIEKGKAIDAWWLEVLFPNHGRGPWRQVGGWTVAIKPGRSWLSSDMQSYLNSSNDRLFSLAGRSAVPYATDLAGTGKLEIIYLSETQYGAWRHKDNLSQFLSPELELGSAVD